MMAAMAYTARFQFSLPHALLPTISRRSTQSLPAIFRRLNRFSSTGLFFSPSSRFRSPTTLVLSQAKRGFSVKEDDVASSVDLEFEAPLKIVEYPDPILRAKNKRIDSFDDNLKKLVSEMFDVMYKTDGIGLSAPQVGVNVQLMVFNEVGERGKGEEIVLVNPRVYKYSKKTMLFDEGCLSFPRIYADVERPESVKIDARDITGARFMGILFFDRMADDVLDSIRPQLQALEKKYEDKTGLPSPERIETFITKKFAAGFGKS